MAQNCVFLQEGADQEKDQEKRVVKVKAANAKWTRMAAYAEPKLNAVEVDNTIQVMIKDTSMTDEKFEAKYGVES